MSNTIPDIQSHIDTRQLAVHRAGIRALRHPILLRTASGKIEPSIALFNMDVHLSATQKGTHMSRLVELLMQQTEPIDFFSLPALMQHMLSKLEAKEGRIELQFPYFIKKYAPVSKVESLMDYQVTWTLSMHDQVLSRALSVQVPLTSLCPCSKMISEQGAHNQRSLVNLHICLGDTPITIEELIQIAEQEASAPLWSLLKRPDEKFVTELAYHNPKFVEDLVRDIAQHLNKDPRILAYTVEAENFESIHNHSAYALIERPEKSMLM